MTRGAENLQPVFGLGITIAVAAAALPTQGLVVVEQVSLHVAAVLSTLVGMDEQARRRQLHSESILQSTGKYLFGHDGSDLPANYLFADHILVCTQVGSIAIG